MAVDCALEGGLMADTDRPIPEVVSLLLAVQYQDGGIVSRTILKKVSGNVTLFAFDAGQELSEHTTPHEALLYVFEGQAQVSIDSKPHTVEAGYIIQLPANVPHAVQAVQRFKMMLVMLQE
jgi:quercetin dioxygenase-like cupin family protein